MILQKRKGIRQFKPQKPATHDDNMLGIRGSGEDLVSVIAGTKRKSAVFRQRTVIMDGRTRASGEDKKIIRMGLVVEVSDGFGAAIDGANGAATMIGDIVGCEERVIRSNNRVKRAGPIDVVG